MTGVVAEVGSTANNYQILARLATGGMAEIFLARGVSGTGVERYCVLKRILRDRATDVHFVRMFLDEARLAAQLQHPNVAQVYDIGKLGDSYFFTMEYVHGETVRALLHRSRSLRRDVPTGSILTVIAGAAAGLHHAHERLGHDGRPLGIVHRDVSPSNLMISYEGGVKVVDFGVAKAENRAQETRSGTVKGKIAYLSPEQCRGGSIDRRSDLFSLGIVFWEMLTCERLYKRSSDFDNMTAIVTEEPVPPSTRRSSIPPELDQISLRLLAKHPDARFQTANELVEALEEAASRLGTMLSASALSRVLRELFGQRPEPWLELDATAQQGPTEGVTVTSEPVPNELAAPSPAIDLELEHVRDLGGWRAISEPSIAPRSQQLTSPAIPATPPRLELPLAPPPPSYSDPRAAPQPGFGSSSGSHPMHGFPASASQSAYPMVASQPQRSRSWPLVAIVAAAAIVGSLTVWVVMRSGADVPSDAAVIATAPPVDAGEPLVIHADAGQVVDVDAFVADAQLARAVDAGTPAVDAELAAADPIVTAMAAKRYADVVTACGKQPGDHVASCVQAACRQKLEGKARQWYGKLASPAQRRSVVAQCRDLGIELAPRVVKQPPPSVDAGVVDKCAKNPMACQR